MIHQTRFLFKLFITYFTRQQCSDQTQPFNPDFFSKCSSHTLQDNNVVTKHNPANQISFQNWGHACSRDDKSKIGNKRVREQACYEQVLQALHRTTMQCIDQTQPFNPDFFSNCSSHTSQDNNVLTRHNPSNLISFQTVHHILIRLKQCTNKT